MLRPDLPINALSQALVLALCLQLSPSTAGAAETAEALMLEFAQRGYPSPPIALKRLQQAGPPPEAALTLRWAYAYRLADLALMNGDRAQFERAQAQLQTLIDNERCAPCEMALRIFRLHLADPGDGDSYRRQLQALGDVVPAEPALAFDWTLARAGAANLLGDAEAAIADGLRAAEIAESLQQDANRVLALDLLSVVSAARRDLPKAVDYARQGMALARRIGFDHGLASTLMNLSYALAQQKESSERKLVLEELLRLSSATPTLQHFQPGALINLAALSNDIGEHRQALDYAQRAEAQNERHRDPLGHAFALVNRGVAQVHLGRVDEGLAAVQSALTLAEQHGDARERADLLEQQVNALEAAERPAQALKALRRWVQLNDELTRTQREQAIAQLQERAAAQQREREIERLKLAQARDAAELQLRSWRERAWAGAALLVALLAALAWRGWRRSRHHNRRLRHDVQRLADESLHDALTGAWNRRYGESLLQRLANEGASRRGVALLLLDVDHFKRVNDGHGHAAGDAVLVELTRRLQQMLREGDAIVRWGGEEFLLVLPDTAEAGLLTIGGRLLAAIGDAPMPLSQDRELAVRASAGAVLWAPGSGSPWAEQLALADAALYRAKAEGRNRLIVALPERPLVEAELEQLDSLQAQGQLRLLSVAGRPLD